MTPPKPTIGSSHRPLREVVCDEIRRQIIDGSHPSGARLVENKLAEQLGVSRNPIREALRILEAEGFIEMVPRRGAFVSTVSDQEVEDIFEVRSTLEALAGRLAARKCLPSHVAKLERVLEAASRAVDADDVGRVTLLNTQFHEGILDIAGNRYLRDIMLPLRGRMQKIFSESAQSRGPHSLEEHQDILRAIAKHDEDRAGALAAHHVHVAHASCRAQRETAA